MSKYIKMPQEEHLREFGFERQWGFPQTVGLLMEHILKPKERVSDYYNRKGYCLIVTQTVVDYRVFIDVNIGWPGKASDCYYF